MSETPDSSAATLFVVDYDTDAERKRAEYFFDSVEGESTSLHGLTRIVRDGDPSDLYERLVSKVPADAVDTYRLEPLDISAEPETRRIKRRVQGTKQNIESFLEYLFSKRDAVLQTPARNEYEVYTRKGRAEMAYRLEVEDGQTTVRLRIEGYPPAPAYLEEVFTNELTDFSASQS